MDTVLKEQKKASHLVAQYQEGQTLVRSGHWAKAVSVLGAIEDYKDVPALLKEARYGALKDAIAKKQWTEAGQYLDKLPSDYKDVASLRSTVNNALARQYYNEAMQAKAKRDYSEAVRLLEQAKETGGKLPSGFDLEVKVLRTLAAQAEARAAAEAARAEVQARRDELASLKKDMQYYTRGSVGIAVGQVRLTRSLGNHYTQGDWTYVLVFVSVRNVDLEMEHANPNNFTLTAPDGYTVSHDTETYGLNYLDAVNLGKGQSTSGWLAFALPRADKYTLNYRSLTMTASKEIAP